MNTEHTIVIVAVFVILILLVIIFKTMYHSSSSSMKPINPHGPVNPVHPIVPISKGGDIWQNYGIWMQNYVINCVNNPSHSSDMPGFDQILKDMLAHYTSKYNKQQALTFVSIFEHYVKLNIQNIQLGDCGQVNLPDNGLGFAHPMALMLGLKSQQQESLIGRIWLNHTNAVMMEYCALKSGNKQNAQAWFKKDTANIAQLSVFE